MPSMSNMLMVGTVAFLAYCVYFDRKRRSDPNFKAKLKEKRLKAQRSKENTSQYDIPIFKDASEMQEYFLQQVSKSDDKMMSGNFEEAVVYLALATVVCAQKTEFLSVMQRTLPPQFFQLLLQHYNIANERYVKKLVQSGALNMGGASKSSTKAQQQFNDTDIE